MEEEKIIDKDQKEISAESIAVMKEEWEKKYNALEEKYENKLKEMHENHIKEIREIMTTGTSPVAQEIQQEDDRYEDEIILEHLKNKYKI